MTALKTFSRTWNSKFSLNSLQNNFLQNAFCFMLNWKRHNNRSVNNHWLCYLFLIHRKERRVFIFGCFARNPNTHLTSRKKYFTNLLCITFTIIFLITFSIFIIRFLLQLTLLVFYCVYIPWNCWIWKYCCCCEATNNACNISLFMLSYKNILFSAAILFSKLVHVRAFNIFVIKNFIQLDWFIFPAKKIRKEKVETRSTILANFFAWKFCQKID